LLKRDALRRERRRRGVVGDRLKPEKYSVSLSDVGVKTMVKVHCPVGPAGKLAGQVEVTL
jgi:hypothetical protein